MPVIPSGAYLDSTQEDQEILLEKQAWTDDIPLTQSIYAGTRYSGIPII